MFFLTNTQILKESPVFVCSETNPDIQTLEKQIATLMWFALQELELKNGVKKGKETAMWS